MKLGHFVVFSSLYSCAYHYWKLPTKTGSTMIDDGGYKQNRFYLQDINSIIDGGRRYYEKKI